jgi:uncharacterized cupredoxin-like copper-binding protein
VSPTATSSGQNVFTITNGGAIVHQFVIARTDLPEDQLPVTKVGAVDVSAVTVLSSSGDIIPGARTSLSVPLTPGRYVLFCNLRGHYQSGMHAGFVVR